jgi:hypothetical protein
VEQQICKEKQCEDLNWRTEDQQWDNGKTGKWENGRMKDNRKTGKWENGKTGKPKNGKMGE